MTPEERAQLERLLASQAPKEWTAEARWLSDLNQPFVRAGTENQKPQYGPQQFDLGATASLMNPTAFETVNSAPRTEAATHYGPQQPDLMTDYGQLVGQGALDAMQTGERILSAGERLSWATSTGAPQEEVDAIFEEVREGTSTYGTMYRERGIPDGIAEVMGLTTALFEFDPTGPAGAVMDAARIARHLPEAIALIPGVPIAMQKLMARTLPDMLKDADGTPLRLFHATGNRGGLAGEVGIANKEQHGHWGFFMTPNVENTFEYLGRYDSTQGNIIEGVIVPRSQDSTIQSNNFLGNFGGGTVGAPRTIADLALDQQDTLQQIADSLLEMARVADAEKGMNPMAAGALTRDLEPRVSGLLNPANNEDLAKVLNYLQFWGKDLMRTSDDAMELAMRNANVVTGADPRIGTTRFFPNDVPPMPDLQTPAGSYTDYARRLGYDVGLGPLTDNQMGDVAFMPQGETFATEVVTYSPNTNLIRTDVSVDQIADDMIRMGIATEDEVRAAMNSPIPETNFLLGNEIVDVDAAAQELANNVFGSTTSKDLNILRLNANDIKDDVLNEVMGQVSWASFFGRGDMAEVPGVDALVQAIWDKTQDIIRSR